MPGLRHAHTLQQLKSFVEYSPPGEYLNKTKTTTKQLQTKTETKRDKRSEQETTSLRK